MHDRSHRRLKLARLLLGFSLLLGLAFFVVGVVLWVNPLGVVRWLARGQLPAAGLERVTLDVPSGEVVYYRGGPTRRDQPRSTVVMVHGLGDQAATWAGVVGELLPQHRLLLLDLPGHGASEPEDGPLTVDDHLAALAALIDLEAHREPVVLVANSMGGWVSLLYAQGRPERVAHLVLVGSAGLTSDLGGVNLIPETEEEGRAMIAAVIGPEAGEKTPGFFVDDLLDKVQDGAAARMRDGFDPSRFLDGELGGIRVPADLVWGDQDGLFSLDYARRMEAELPDARLHVLEGCAHALQMTCSDRFAELLEDLLEDVRPAVR